MTSLEEHALHIDGFITGLQNKLRPMNLKKVAKETGIPYSQVWKIANNTVKHKNLEYVATLLNYIKAL